MRELKHSTAADPDDLEVAAVIAEDQAEDEDADSDDEETWSLSREEIPWTQQLILYPYFFYLGLGPRTF